MALQTLNNQIISAEACNILAKNLQFLNKVVTTSFSTENANAVVVKTVSDATVAKNATSYTNSTVGESITITLTELSTKAQVTPEDKRNSWKLAQLINTHVNKLVNEVIATTLGVIKTGTEVVGASTSFTPSKMKTLSGKVEDFGNGIYSIMNKDYYVQLLPDNTLGFNLSDGGYGFDGIYKAQSTAFASGVVGVILNPNGIAVASALPTHDINSAAIETEVITVPDLGGFSILVEKFVDTSTMSDCLLFRVLFGAAVLDPNSVKGMKVS